MIDDSALKTLIALHERKAAPRLACRIFKSVATVHSVHLVVELPAKEVQLVNGLWPTPPWENISKWRTWIPDAGAGYRSTMVASEEGYARFTALESDDVRFLREGFHAFLRDQLDNPVFRIMPGPQMGVGVFVDDELVGAVTARLQPDPE